jgi:hypothetical protein
MAAIVDCPVCARKLRIPDDLLGDMVRCPTCGSAFAAPGEALSLPPRPAADVPVPTETVAPLEIAPRQTIPRVPALRPMLVGEEKGKPNMEKEHALPPTRDARRSPAHSEDVPDCEPHRAGLVLGLGIVSMILSATCLLSIFGLPIGVAAWAIGQRDLEKIRAGAMDPKGMNTTHAGWICGIVGTVLNALVVVYLALAFVGHF